MRASLYFVHKLKLNTCNYIKYNKYTLLIIQNYKYTNDANEILNILLKNTLQMK